MMAALPGGDDNPPTSVATLPHDVVALVFERISCDLLQPAAATSFSAACRNTWSCTELHTQLAELKEDHRRACALCTRCCDWDRRFRDGRPVERILWVSIGLVTADCVLLARMLTSAMISTSLQTLSLRDNGIRPQGMAALCSGLRHCESLQYLNLEQNELGAPVADAAQPARSSGLDSFVDLIEPQRFQHLKRLYLADNGLESRLTASGLLLERLIAKVNDGCLPALPRCGGTIFSCSRVLYVRERDRLDQVTVDL